MEIEKMEEAGEKNTNGAWEMKDDEPQDGKEGTVKKARNIISFALNRSDTSWKHHKMNCSLYLWFISSLVTSLFFVFLFTFTFGQVRMVTNWKQSRKCEGRDWSSPSNTNLELHRENKLVHFHMYHDTLLVKHWIVFYLLLTSNLKEVSLSLSVGETDPLNSWWEWKRGLLICRGNVFKEMFDWSLKRLGKEW